jgi:hypothetical protein
MKAEVKELPAETMELQMGPSHPATHGTIKFNLKLEGEKVLDCDVEVGFLHRGFDKSCEQATWTQVIPYTDRLNYASSLINNVGYALAVTPTALRLAERGGEVSLEIYLHVREDALQLYGFGEAAERELFDRYIALRRGRGDDVAGIAFEAFRARLREEAQKLKQQTGAANVEFEVTEREGRVKLDGEDREVTVIGPRSHDEIVAAQEQHLQRKS